MKVAIIGATGQTGSIIIKALLESTTPKFEITALTRAASLQKPAVLELATRGVNIVSCDLHASVEDLKQCVDGMDVVISTIYGGNVLDEIPLINASKAAGVKRFVPCFFATVAPPKGALLLREMKEDVLNHIKSIRMPYTAIDVGWWYQVNLPRLPSGRIDYAVMESNDGIAGDGNVPFAMSDLRDVGNYVARIIADPRTLNQLVFAYNEVFSQNQIHDLLEGLSGEKTHRKYVPIETIEANIAKLSANTPSPDSFEFVVLAQYQYWYSCCVRGDNTPENAKYLGYLLTKDLYPDINGIGLAAYAQDVIDGKGKRVYEHLKDLPAVTAGMTA